LSTLRKWEGQVTKEESIMLEIVGVILLCNANKKNATARGVRPGKYIGFTILLWFGLEIIGALIGAAADLGMGSYVLALVFAGIGGFISYRLAKGKGAQAAPVAPQTYYPQANTPAAGIPQAYPVAKFCSFCGTPAVAGARFCQKCGKSLVVQGQPAQPPAQAAAPVAAYQPAQPPAQAAATVAAYQPARPPAQAAATVAAYQPAPAAAAGMQRAQLVAAARAVFNNPFSPMTYDPNHTLWKEPIQKELDMLIRGGTESVSVLGELLMQCAAGQGGAISNSWWYGSGWAVKAIAMLPKKEAADLMVRLLQKESNIAEWYTYVQREAAYQLGVLGDASVLPALLGLLERPLPMAPVDVIAKAVETLNINRQR
jgi:hypothetical protein